MKKNMRKTVTFLLAFLIIFEMIGRPFSTLLFGMDMPVVAAAQGAPADIYAWRNLSGEQIRALAANLTAFDARDYGVVPPVKSQGSDPLCWAYGATSATEVSILKEGFAASKNSANLDFSEHNAAYRIMNKTTNPYPSTNPETFISDSWNNGRVVSSVTNLYTQWRGPVERAETGGLYGELRYLGDDFTKYLLEAMIRLPELPKGDEAGIQLYKEYVLRYGAVSVSYAYNPSPSAEYWNADGSKNMKHQVAIVGWDDSISADTFYPNASRNGGWLIRDSWGSWAHGDGYFWLSYDSLLKDCIVYDFGPMRYDYNYYYDSDVNANSVFKNRQPSYVRVANIYKAVMGTPSKQEVLKAANVAIYGNNTTAKIEIYKGLTGINEYNIYDQTNNPIQGEPVSVTNRFFDRMGHYTIDLDTPVPLEKGEFFSIVVTVSNPEGNASVYYSREPDSSVNDLSYYYVESSNQWISTKIDEGVNAVARVKGYTIMVERDESLSTHLKNANIIVHGSLYQYDGYEKTPDVSVTYDGVPLTKDVDYVLAYSNNRFPGTASVYVVGLGQFDGQIVEGNFEIARSEYPYGGNPQSSVMHNVYENEATYLYELPLPDGWQYVNPDMLLSEFPIGQQTPVEIQYVAADAGNYNITTARAWITVNSGVRTEIKYLMQPSLKETNFIYNGEPIRPAINMIVNDSYFGITYEATQGSNYYITYENNIEPGTARAIVKGMQGSIGEYVLEFYIAPNEKIGFGDVTLEYQVENNEFTFEPVTPEVNVYSNGSPLTRNQDYVIGYTNNEAAGRGRMIIVGINNYEGVVTSEFGIVDAAGPSTEVMPPERTEDLGEIDAPIPPTTDGSIETNPSHGNNNNDDCVDCDKPVEDECPDCNLPKEDCPDCKVPEEEECPDCDLPKEDCPGCDIEDDTCDGCDLPNENIQTQGGAIAINPGKAFNRNGLINNGDYNTCMDVITDQVVDLPALISARNKKDQYTMLLAFRSGCTICTSLMSQIANADENSPLKSSNLRIYAVESSTIAMGSGLQKNAYGKLQNTGMLSLKNLRGLYNLDTFYWFPNQLDHLNMGYGNVHIPAVVLLKGNGDVPVASFYSFRGATARDYENAMISLADGKPFDFSNYDYEEDDISDPLPEEPVHTHTVTEKPAKKATCDESGYTRGEYCSECNEILLEQTLIRATGHLNTEVRNNRPATTESDGYTGDIYCADCGKKLSNGRILPKVIPHNHEYSKSWSYNSDKHWHATICGHNEKGDEGNHVIVIDKAVFPTETKTGLTEGSHCSVCNYVIKKQETIPVIVKEHNHTYETELSSNEMFHWYDSTCEHDLKKDQELHTIVKDEMIPATEERTGLTEGSHCSTCGYVIVEQEVIPRRPEHKHLFNSEWNFNNSVHWHASSCGHDIVSDEAIHVYGTWTVAQQPTTSTTGLRERFCNVCNYRVTEEIDKLPIIPIIHKHEYETVWTSNDTYHWQASSCGHDTIIGRGTHAYGDWITVKAPTAVMTGEQERYCLVCNHKNTGIIPATGVTDIQDKNNNNQTDKAPDKNEDAKPLSFEELIVNSISTTYEGGTITVSYASDSKVSKNVFEALRGQKKILELYSPNGVTWVFNGIDIKNDIKDIYLGVNLGYLGDSSGTTIDLINKLVENTRQTVVLNFPENGVLPGKATVKVSLDGDMINYLGATGIHLYYVNVKTGMLELVEENLSVKAGNTIDLPIEHNSTFILTRGAVGELSNNNQGLISPGINNTIGTDVYRNDNMNTLNSATLIATNTSTATDQGNTPTEGAQGNIVAVNGTTGGNDVTGNENGGNVTVVDTGNTITSTDTTANQNTSNQENATNTNPNTPTSVSAPFTGDRGYDVAIITMLMYICIGVVLLYIASRKEADIGCTVATRHINKKDIRNYIEAKKYLDKYFGMD